MSALPLPVQRLADKLDIDLLQAARDKIVENAAKYPVEKAKGVDALQGMMAGKQEFVLLDERKLPYALEEYHSSIRPGAAGSFASSPAGGRYIFAM